MDMQSGRSLPKNFRQIGSAEKSTKVYIEDYVYTFMRKLGEEGEISVGALIGNNVVREGVECVFVSGMVKACGYTVSDGKIIITDNTWAAVFENVKKYFDGMTVCGWFVSGQDSEFLRQPVISGVNNNGNYNFSIIYVRDREGDEDYIYKITPHGKERLNGYYIFYERNEKMQEYMIDTSGSKSVDPPPVNIMNRLKSGEIKAAESEAKSEKFDYETDNKTTEPEKKGGRLMYVAASLLVLSIVALGVSVYRNGAENTFGKIKSVVASVTVNSSQQEESEEETEPASEAGLIIENAPGIVESTEPSVEETTPIESVSEEAASEEGASEAEASVQPENIAETTAIAESASIVETAAPETEAAVQAPVEALPEETIAEPQPAEPVQAQVSPGSSYIVQSGDTLSSICIKVYGREDMAKIEEMRNLNGLENADYIFVGQVIQIP